jgi:hypothetical protein
VVSGHIGRPSLDDEDAWEHRRRIWRAVAVIIVVVVSMVALAAGVVALANRHREYHPVIDCVSGYHQSGNRCVRN